MEKKQLKMIASATLGWRSCNNRKYNVFLENKYKRLVYTD